MGSSNLFLNLSVVCIGKCPILSSANNDVFCQLFFKISNLVFLIHHFFILKLQSGTGLPRFEEISEPIPARQWLSQASLDWGVEVGRFWYLEKMFPLGANGRTEVVEVGSYFVKC